jgi:DUF1680 family protein
MKTVWEDVVYRNMYITGGIGSSGSNEGFSHDYDLPNEVPTAKPAPRWAWCSGTSA